MTNPESFPASEQPPTPESAVIPEIVNQQEISQTQEPILDNEQIENINKLADVARQEEQKNPEKIAALKEGINQKFDIQEELGRTSKMSVQEWIDFRKKEDADKDTLRKQKEQQERERQNRLHKEWMDKEEQKKTKQQESWQKNADDNKKIHEEVLKKQTEEHKKQMEKIREQNEKWRLESEEEDKKWEESQKKQAEEQKKKLDESIKSFDRTMDAVKKQREKEEKEKKEAEAKKREEEQKNKESRGNNRESSEIPLDNYYQILGVASTVSRKEIDSAYRKKVLQFHPDRNIGNEKIATERFKKVQEAYDFLTKS